jgi:hypothetical protein
MCQDGEKPAFLSKLHELYQIQTRQWLLGGNFNMIYRAQDSNNNDRINRHLMGQIYHFLNEAVLQEAHFNGGCLLGAMSMSTPPSSASTVFSSPMHGRPSTLGTSFTRCPPYAPTMAPICST